MDMKRIPVIFFIGVSGSGKDTQADFLIDNYGFIKISSGNILREIKKEAEGNPDNYEAGVIKRILDDGKFVPTLTIASRWYHILIDLIHKMKFSHGPKDKIKGIIFSSSPRKLAEALLLEDFFNTWPEASVFETRPIFIDVSEKEALRRLQNRLVCASCKKNFMITNKEDKPVKCDSCGGVLEVRHDDTEENIKSRFREFKEFLIPVIDFYGKNNKLATIKGEQSVEGVYKDIIGVLSLDK